MTEMLKRDVEYLKASPSELEAYLLSHDIIRQLPDFSFSAGGILLAYKRLESASLINEQVEANWKEIQTIRDHWKTAWATKCHQEYKMRLRQWGDFILGFASDKNEPSTAFRHQVRNRVIMHLLDSSNPAITAEFAESIQRKDKILDKYSVENDFVWEKEVQPGFPREDYWYLYRVMRYEKDGK
ncbi:hypothetical protein [Leptolinea tardivitalis]|uniref:Uncharacterized protein n=1 Tax=Leptolinea tardivitalis TaxID=229920 RepID=A0A0P6XK11_9CHLR|nr:hypothetical protein [Leptolinea tardivitalis]KPL71755.1 hypothetical protein ADM99_09945 [Leptolinea tardivitalis]GAP20125.1 hypothetical protein LTAR_00311 [Leptolinea tardivitalis]